MLTMLSCPHTKLDFFDKEEGLQLSCWCVVMVFIICLFSFHLQMMFLAECF